MSAGWVAGSVRAKALARRRLGAEQTRRLASCGSLSDALRILAATAYGVNLRPDIGAIAGIGQHPQRVAQ